ncbi:MAG: hypothetical protein IPL55_14720 [Saprospiraceae bacterium]|nr:hypothetical protein [Saprospiraceae bacterium]
MYFVLPHSYFPKYISSRIKGNFSIRLTSKLGKPKSSTTLSNTMYAHLAFEGKGSQVLREVYHIIDSAFAQPTFKKFFKHQK